MKVIDNIRAEDFSYKLNLVSNNTNHIEAFLLVKISSILSE